MEEQGRFQTRNEEGALTFEPTFEAALKKAKEDLTIWKISWTDEGTGERIRLLRRFIDSEWRWLYEPIILDCDNFDPRSNVYQRR